MVEKIYHLAQYLGPFGANVMTQGPIQGSKEVPMYQNDRWKVAINLCYLQSGQKNKHQFWLKMIPKEKKEKIPRKKT